MGGECCCALSRQTSYGERAYDVYTRLLKDRIVCLHAPVRPEIASIVIAQLLFLDQSDPGTPIHLYISSPGGNVDDGLAIYDTMRYVRSPVHTVGMGMVASMGSLLLTAGEPGHRYALPNCRVMAHQPHGGTQGQASDIKIHAEQILKLRARIQQMYAEHTGQAAETIERTLERDSYMTAEEARAFGLIDAVIGRGEAKGVARKTGRRPKSEQQ